jgi:hypothetical protein
VATLAVQSIGLGGLSPSYAAASSGGDKLRPGRTTFLHVKNSGAASATVTLATPGTVGGLAIADRAVTVAAGGSQMIPVPADLYADPADSGLAAITYSDATDLTVGAFRA